MSRISENMKKTRLSSGLSQKQLAKKLGTSESFINEVENGRKVLSDSMISRLSKIFNIDLDDINMYSEEQKNDEEVVVKRAKEEKVNEVWSDAFSSVIKSVPVYEYNLKTIAETKQMPVMSNKIEGFSQDKVAFLLIEDDEMMGFRVTKGDIAFVYVNHEIENNSICLIEYNQLRCIRQIKKLDANKVLLISNGGSSLRTETVNPKDIKVLARLVKLEIKL